MGSRRTWRLFGILVVSLAVVAAACSSDDSSTSDSSTTSAQDSSGGAPFRAATYNAGLAVGFVDFAEERAPVVAEELGMLDTELLVLQEIWEPEHVALVEEAAGEQYPNQIFLEPQPGEGYVYGGSFGIGVLTDQEIVDQDTLVMESSLNRRAVIYAELDTDQIGTVHVFATHLSAIFSDIPFPGEGTWEQEQADQIDAMLAFVDEMVDDDSPVLVMGDFNTGPDGELFDAEFVENYDAIVEGGGFDSPYADNDESECTWCEANTLIDEGDTDRLVIDHVFVRRFDGTVDTERIYDSKVSVVVDGQETMNLSDHFGILATLTPNTG